MSPLHQIVMANPQDVDRLSEVIARSFHNLAPSIWLVGDPDVRRRVFPGYFRLLVEDAMRRGRVYTTLDREAAALWLPGHDTGEPSPSGYDAALAAVTGGSADRFRMFDELLAKASPAGLRHEHLAILAVDPDRQRHGIGTALLAAHHHHIDTSAHPPAAYLEASDPATRELYLRHGYTDHGDPIALPEGPYMYPMVRPAPAPNRAEKGSGQ